MMCAALIPGLRPLDGSCRILRSPVSRFTGFRGYRALNASTVPTTDELRARYRNMEINRIFILEKITKYDLEIRNGLSDYEICNRFPRMFMYTDLIRQISCLPNTSNPFKSYGIPFAPVEGEIWYPHHCC